MASCNHCGTTILFGGKRDAQGGVYCNEKCEACGILSREINSSPFAMNNQRVIGCRERIGRLLKSELSISEECLRWKRKEYPIDGINGVRWGITRTNVNLMARATDCVVGFGNDRTSDEISLGDELQFLRIVNCLWSAVSRRLVRELQYGLANGRSFNFGTIEIADYTVRLKRKNFLGGVVESVQLPLNQVYFRSSNGSLVATAVNEPSLSGSASYQRDWNTHVLQRLLAEWASGAKLTSLSSVASLAHER